MSDARRVHLGRIPAAELPRHQGSLEDHWDQSVQEVVRIEDVLEDARRLAQRFPLRTNDAIHLASARESRRMLRGLFEGEVRFLADLIGGCLPFHLPSGGVQERPGSHQTVAQVRAHAYHL